MAGEGMGGLGMGGLGMGGNAQLTALYLQHPELANAIRRQQVAQPLVQAGTSADPIRSPWQGVARLANAALGGYLMRKSDNQIEDVATQQRTQREKDDKELNDLIGKSLAMGGGAPAGPTYPPMQAGPISLAPDTANRSHDMIGRLQARGIAPLDAIAIAARAIPESGARMDPGSRGDGGRSAGYLQWNNDRLANFQRVVGVQPEKATPDQVADFIHWELKGPEAKAYAQIQAAPDLSGKAAAVTSGYIRPANQGVEIPKTVGYAHALAGSSPGAPQPAPNYPGSAESYSRAAMEILMRGKGNPRAEAAAAFLNQRAAAAMAQENYQRGRTDKLDDRAHTEAMRPVQTTTMLDPETGKPTIFQILPGGAMGPKLGLAAHQPEEAPPLGKTEIALAGGHLDKIAPLILAGTATQEQIGLFRRSGEAYISSSFDPATGRVNQGRGLSPDVVAAFDRLKTPTTSQWASAAGSNNPLEQPPSAQITPTGSIRTTQAPVSSSGAFDAYRTAEAEAGKVTDAAKEFMRQLKLSGGTGINSYLDNPKDPRAIALNQAHNRLQEAMRGESFMNTGVLQPAEMKLLEQRLLDPRSIRGWLATDASYQSMVDSLHTTVQAGLTRKRALAGLPPMPGASAAGAPEPPGAELPVMPGWKVERR